MSKNNNPPPSDYPEIDNFWLTNKHVVHPSLDIGDYTYGIPSISVNYKGGRIKIGKFCSIANTALLLINAEHRTTWFCKYPFYRLKSVYPKAADLTSQGVGLRGNITIGNDVWIGAGAVILGGADIGDGAVIGSQAVVAGRVDPYEKVVGNPARGIGYCFSEERIEKMLEIEWWNWPIETITECAHLLCSEKEEDLLTLIEISKSIRS